MKLIDITVGISNGMLVWPGDEPVRLGWESRIADGASSNVSSIKMGAHVGTHIDMPLHFIEGAANLDNLDLACLIGTATVVEVPDSIMSIDASFLEGLRIEDVSRLLFKTSNSKLWDHPSQPFKPDYVAIESNAARWLVERGCKLVGIDYLSIAPYNDLVTPHEILLSNNVIILETLDLRNASPGEYELVCLPLKLESREASPVRAVLKTTD
ncbi:MAG: cyclase family protein [Anaerolineaceae bacterium]|nr:cyclase family protein [Anaerolineaceae bacterium]